MEARRNEIDRRRALLTGIGAIGGLSLLGSSARAEVLRAFGGALGGGRTLVIVELAGGNDGLSMVVPHGDDEYHRLRRTIRIKKKDARRIDDYVGLHPALEMLDGLYRDGRVAIVQGAGYPQPNRSHFKSFDIWHTADRRGRNAGEGWVGRLCQTAFGDRAMPNRVVHVGGSAPYSLHSTRHPAVSFAVPYGYRWVKNEQDLAEVSEAKDAAKDDSLEYLRGVMKDARLSSAAIRAAAMHYRPSRKYPSDGFADSLRAVAALINGNVGSRILSVSLGGFDTHNDQRNRHDALMRTLDASLGAFLRDLEATQAGRETVVMVFSEFGRRVAENGSGGTDHGCAGPMLVAGHAVKGGLYGEHPSLTELDKGDLVFTTDFRRVYAAVTEACFDIDSRQVLGGGFEPLALV